MANGKKKKASVNEDVEAYRHEGEIGKNVVQVRLVSYDTSRPKLKKYEYDPHLELLISTRSMPFKLGKEKRIVVKATDYRGNEVMVVREMK